WNFIHATFFDCQDDLRETAITSCNRQRFAVEVKRDAVLRNVIIYFAHVMLQVFQLLLSIAIISLTNSAFEMPCVNAFIYLLSLISTPLFFLIGQFLKNFS